jgi:glycosyltransferase involved in cell wall biosynthesis
MRASVVIPTYMGAPPIGLLLADIPAGMVEQVLVVHSDSTDGTAQIASQMGAEVSHERRGAAMIGRAHRTAAVNALLERDYSERPAKMFRLLVPQHCHRREFCVNRGALRSGLFPAI